MRCARLVQHMDAYKQSDQDERQTEMQDALHDALKYLVLHSMWLQQPFCICDYVHIS